MALQATEQCPNFASLLERRPTTLNDTFLYFDLFDKSLPTVKVLIMYEAPGMAWKTLPNDHASIGTLDFQHVFRKPIYRKNHGGSVSLTRSPVVDTDDDNLRVEPICTASKDTFGSILSWSRICTEKHEVCAKWREINGIEESLPTRLLAFSSDPDEHSAKLILGEHLPKGSRYMTLSHCWGGHSPITLTKDNIGDLRREIPWERLPQTFKDAIIVVKSLNAQYLWIDALCIIQDSESDWAIEGGKMATVYANSSLNIAADASKDANGGLFRDRDPTRLRFFAIPDYDNYDEVYHGHCCYPSEWERNVESAALNQRAWVVQERFLAARVVHFTEGQVHWECPSCTTSEGLPFGLSLLREQNSMLKNFRPHPDTKWYRDAVLTSWRRLVRKYSRCHLTVSSDKPVAIAGLARAFCNLLRLQPTDYACGLWRPTFVLDLIWVCKDAVSTQPTAIQKPDKAFGPSWSWLSVRKQVEQVQPVESFDFFRITVVAELLEVETTPTGDPFGSVSSAFAKIRAPLCLLSLNESRLGRYTLAFNGESFDHFALFPDADITSLENHNGPVYLLLLARTRVHSAKFRHHEPAWRWSAGVEEALSDDMETLYHCLALRPTGLHGEFCRIGLIVILHDELDKTWLTHSVKFSCSIEHRFCSYDVPTHLYESVDDDFFHTITLV